MEDFGIFNPQFIERLKGDWERVAAEMKRATTPLREEAEHLYEDVFGAAHYHVMVAIAALTFWLHSSGAP